MITATLRKHLTVGFVLNYIYAPSLQLSELRDSTLKFDFHISGTRYCVECISLLSTV